MNRVLALAALAALVAPAGCGGDNDRAAPVQTAAVERRDIVIDVEATGVVEPINVVEVKSKASGQITRMPVETGSHVRPGDLLVQLDTRDVRNQYNQALADLRAAEARQQVSAAQKKRADELAGQRIITAQEHEAAALDYANSQAQLVRARTSLDLAQQRLEDATVRAPVAGTVIEKLVSLGQVITSATGSFGGGTTLLKMADLGQVRVRALVNETDIGNVQPGQSATVTVDAYPDRPFRGTVEKIEPQAVVQQSVTMFPVLVTIENREGLLKPGMNGEVSVLVERREGVLAVPNDAVRNPREAATAAALLGLDPDAVRSQLQAQTAALGARPGADAAPAGDAGPPVVAVSAVRAASTESRGEPALAEPRQGDGQQAPQASEQACAEFRAAVARQPGLEDKLRAVRARMMSGELEREAAMREMRELYAGAGVDPRLARACGRRARPDGAGGAQTAPATAAQGGERGGVTMQPGTPPGAIPEGFPAQARGRGRPGLVFIADSGTFLPRLVRLGVSNYDYTEVIRGLEEGDSVAVLSSVALQQQRQRMQERIRNMGGVPGMQRQQGGAAGGGGAGGGGGRP